MAENKDGFFKELKCFSNISQKQENHKAIATHTVIYGHKRLFVWSPYLNVFSCPKSECPRIDQSYKMHICLSFPCMSYLEFF